MRIVTEQKREQRRPFESLRDLYAEIIIRED